MYGTFHQNNSGGRFHVNENVAHFVIIEGDSAADINEKAEEIGIYFNGCANEIDCSCCGDRWSIIYELDLTEKPEIYGKDFTEIKNFGSDWSQVIIHYKNGIERHLENPS